MYSDSVFFFFNFYFYFILLYNTVLVHVWDRMYIIRGGFMSMYGKTDSVFYKNKLVQEYNKNNPYRLAIFYLKDREQEEQSYLQGYLQLSKVDV